jgi:hypothetical protein
MKTGRDVPDFAFIACIPENPYLPTNSLALYTCPMNGSDSLLIDIIPMTLRTEFRRW